jgi:hypothetical protein
MHERINYIIKCVPRFFDIAFRQHFWLLYHPNVCKISFEELVGSKGGGDYLQQIWAVIKIMTHLKISGDPQIIANQIFSTEARTFRKGQIGDWKNHFSEQNINDFNNKFGDILEIYGYSNHI